MAYTAFPLDEFGNEIRDANNHAAAPADVLSLSYDEVRRQLDRINQLVREGKFHIQLGDSVAGVSSRRKNREFMQRYGIWSLRDKQDLLLRVDVEDFCHAFVANDGSVLYVFCLDTHLELEGSGRRRVRICIKHNYPAPGTKRDVVISLHALERPIVLPFRD